MNLKLQRHIFFSIKSNSFLFQVIVSVDERRPNLMQITKTDDSGWLACQIEVHVQLLLLLLMILMMLLSATCDRAAVMQQLHYLWQQQEQY